VTRLHARRLTLVIGLVLGSPAILGCDVSDCEDYYEPPSYRISVLDKESRVAICDAEVKVGDTPARKSSIDCTHVLEIPSGDAAIISAQAPGYSPSTVSVPTRYEKDSCGHAIAVPVVVELVKTP